jgi:hypothetical protein
VHLLEIILISLLKVTFTGADVVPFKTGDSLGLTWFNTGNIPFDYPTAQNYCEDRVIVGAVGSTMSLIANRLGDREYSLNASFCKYTPPYNTLLETVLFVQIMIYNNCVLRIFVDCRSSTVNVY